MLSCSPINDTVNTETGDIKPTLVRNKAQKKQFDLTPGFPKIDLTAYARHCEDSSVYRLENILHCAMAHEFTTKPNQIVMERVCNNNVPNEQFVVQKVNLLNSFNLSFFFNIFFKLIVHKSSLLYIVTI